MGILSVAIRSGLAIYAVKYTIDEGAWAEPDKAIAFKNKVCEGVNENYVISTGKLHFQTYVFEFPELPELPPKSELCFITKHYYNKSIKSSVKFIEMLPCYAGQGIKKASDAIKSALDQPKVEKS